MSGSPAPAGDTGSASPGPGTPSQGAGAGPRPPVQLPLLGESASQGLQGAGSQAFEPDDADELDEEALFGSEEEETAPPAGPAPPSTAAASSAGGATRSPAPAPAERLDDVLEKDLFGDDDVDEKELFGSDGEPDIDERELFGSDDDEKAPAKPTAPDSEVKGAVPAPSEPSELDEHEIFGDISDEEPEKVEDVILRRRPAPGDDREFRSLRLPNVLSVEKSAFRPDSMPQSLLEGYREYQNTRNSNVVKLLNPENCVRWRFKKGPDGQNLTDEDGRPQYESNARIVEWEDGTRTLFVGNEVFNMSEIEDRVVLFEENSQDVHVCHGVLRKRLVATPRSLSSVTHDSLKRAQYRKYEPMRRSLLLSQEEQAQTKQLYELEMEQKKRQEQKQRRAAEPGRQEITAAFLEDQPEAAGPSVLDVKRAYKSNNEPSKRQKRG